MNSHLERAIQKAMSELDKQSEKPIVSATTSSSTSSSMTTMTTAVIKSGKGNCEKKPVNQSPKAIKSRTIKIAPAPSKS